MLNLNNEIKIKIENPDEIISKLRDKCAVLIGGVKEVTTRYDFEEETLEKSGKFVRTRTGFKNIISIYSFSFSSSIHSCNFSYNI